MFAKLMAATGKDIAEYVITLAKVIPTYLVMDSPAPLQMTIHRLRKDQLEM